MEKPHQDNRVAKLEMSKYIFSTFEIAKSELTKPDGYFSDGYFSDGSCSGGSCSGGSNPEGLHFQTLSKSPIREVTNSERLRQQSRIETSTSNFSNSEGLCLQSFTETSDSQSTNSQNANSQTAPSDAAVSKTAHSEILPQQSATETSSSERLNPEIFPLQSLYSQVLIANVKSLTQKEKALTMQIIDYLSEIARRRAYLPKYTSLFTFLVEELGYCPSTAMLRINAIKAFAAVPEIRKKVLDNKMSLNAVSRTQSFINQQMREDQNKDKAPLTKEEQRELFAAIENTPASQIEDTLHERKQELDARKAEAKGEPPPPREVRTQKVTLEVDGELQKMVEELKSLLSHTHPGASLSILLKQVLPSAIEKLKRDRGLVKVKRKATDLSSMELGGRAAAPSSLVELGECTSAPSTSMKLTASASAPSTSMKLTESASAPSSAVELGASTGEPHSLIELGECTAAARSKMKLSVRRSEEDPTRTQKKVQAQTQSQTQVKSQSQVKEATDFTRKHVKTIKRGIPASIKQLVWSRDQGCCQYRDPKSQKTCGSRHQVQFDHIKPWSIGGEHSSENLRLLCGVHNRHRSRTFGL